jgi:EAL domain-containing protein (putative c-di-GMP-specific phosphodiesterase class I)
MAVAATMSPSFRLRRTMSRLSFLGVMEMSPTRTLYRDIAVPQRLLTGQAYIWGLNLWAEWRVVRERILSGIRDGEFELLYQPQLTADGERVVAVEALLRWTTAEGPVPVVEFIANAETSGAILELGAFALRQACLDALDWPQVRIAVNISALQLREQNFAKTVEGIVREVGLPLERLELEIVESALIEDFAHAEAQITELRRLGMTVALDDFGTGYSSLTYLRKLPLDKLKIDGSIVADVDKVQSAAIVQALVALARAIGLKITAEGVETESQHRFLRACGCHYLQGYLFSRPVRADVITEMLAQQQRRQVDFAVGLRARTMR